MAIHRLWTSLRFTRTRLWRSLDTKEHCCHSRSHTVPTSSISTQNRSSFITAHHQTDGGPKFSSLLFSGRGGAREFGADTKFGILHSCTNRIVWLCSIHISLLVGGAVGRIAFSSERDVLLVLDDHSPCVIHRVQYVYSIVEYAYADEHLVRPLVDVVVSQEPLDKRLVLLRHL